MSVRAERLTIAFMPVGEADWHGGQSLINNAMKALREVGGARVRILTVGSKRQYPGADGVLTSIAPPKWAPRRIVSALAIRIARRNLVLEQILRAGGVDVLVGETLPWRLGGIATMSWLQDLQHRHHAELFDARERRRRDRVFVDTMRLADRALAMSASVADDARQLAPRYAHKVRIIQPLSLVDPAIYDREPLAVVHTYSLPEKFFYVPNQFWVHKNHRFLFQALRILQERGQHVHVVLTGRAEDYRRPGHFQAVMAQVSEWQLDDQVHYLGVVDRPAVYDLIRQSIGVISPSLFEGWGYAVDEAAAVGKRILASDLPAHREQIPPACDFFDPHDAEALAQRMEQVWRWATPGASPELEAAARERMPLRLQRLGSQLLSVLHEVVIVPSTSAAARVLENVSA